MEVIKIKQFVDNIVINKLLNGYDSTRQHLYDNILKNRSIIQLNIDNFKYDLESIERLPSGRIQYLAYYVFYGQKRVIDLYNLEKKLKDYTPTKAFKSLLFKEKMTI